jgi:RNA polymerase sigma-70 factor (ECF subfamily)
MNTSTNITAKLVQWSNGDIDAMDELYPVIERELRRLARSLVRRMEPGNTLRTTALINEAYIRLVEQNRVTWKNRSHFFAIAATMMRRVLLNRLRDRKRQKRGGGAIHISLSDVAVISAEKSDEMLALDDALTKLFEFDERMARIVEMRYFGGMTVAEVAEVLGISKVTVMRGWRMAKAWLYREMRDEK